jgi:type IV pilus assembly protein PilM
MSAGSGRLPSFLASAPPPAALEIAADRVTAVVLGGRRGAWTIAGHATERLREGAVTPALNAVNIHDATLVGGAVRSVLERAGGRVRRVALVLPDTAAKVSLVRFEKVPARAQDLDQLVRWQVRKAAPFKPEDAQISWVEGSQLTDGGREFVVTLARRDVVESYERVVAAAGAQAGIIDLSTFDLINAVLAIGAPPGDWLLVHVARDYASLAIVRGPKLIFFRTRPNDAEGDLGDVVHQTAMYYEDRLGGGAFTRVILSGAASAGGAAGEIARASLEARLGTRVESLDFRQTAAMRDRITAGADLLDALAPALGVLLRERSEERVS